MLSLEAIECRYGKVSAVRDVSITVKADELVTVIGANGAGKSTTLRAISGLIKPAKGRITFEGRDITGLAAPDVLKCGIAHCPEGRRVFPQLTVRENLEMGAYLRKDEAEIKRDFERIFDRFPRLGERRGQVAGTLSGGEQQMLAIGRTLMSRPKLALFDEPSLGLAPTIVERVFEIIADIRTQGMTILMVEQNALAALEMCDRAYLLEAGQVVNHGTGPDLLANPHVRAAYLGG